MKEPIGLFTVQIGINPNLVSKYFSGIDVSNRLTVNVNPAFLSLATNSNIQENLQNWWFWKEFIIFDYFIWMVNMEVASFKDC